MTHGNTTHGMSKTRTYKIWGCMLQRCTNPKYTGWDDYGGRGIVVCDRWTRFVNFHEDMGDAPDGHSIERLDNEKGYEPGNCKWATPDEQSNNRRTSRKLTHQGRTLTVSQWGRELGLNHQTIHERIRKGWTVQQCLAPLQRKRKRNES